MGLTRRGGPFDRTGGRGLTLERTCASTAPRSRSWLSASPCVRCSRFFPVSSAILAVAFAPPTRIEIAGQRVSVKPVIGQDTSRLLDGALVSPYHAHVALIGKDIGVDVDADWNRLIPSDKRTRDYLTTSGTIRFPRSRASRTPPDIMLSSGEVSASPSEPPSWRAADLL